MKSAWPGAWRSIETSGRTMSRPPATCRKSNAAPPAPGATGRGVEALAEHPLPLVVRHPPLAVARQHLRVVGPESAPLEGGIDLLGHPREEVVRTRRAAGVGEGVVLIGGQRLLAPGDAAQRHPRPRAGSAAVPGDHQLQQPGGGRVRGQRQHPPDVGRRHTGANQGDDRLRQMAGRIHDLVDALRLADRAADGERGAALQVHQVGGRDHAHRHALGVDHRQVVDAQVEHVDHGVDRQPVGGHGEGVGHHQR